MFRENYKAQMAQIKPSEKLLERVIQRAKEEENIENKGNAGHKYRRGVAWRKPAVAVAAAGLCIFFAMPVLASSSDNFYQLLYTVSPSAAQFFIPVQRADESSGIKMEVVSAYIYENKAEIYITMQDLTQDRIDGTTDLYDSYSINRPFDSMAHCKFAGYDESTKTAAFLIVVEEWGGKDISGDKMTFSVRAFLSHKEKFEDIAIPVDMNRVWQEAKTQSVSLIGTGGEYKNYMVSLGDDTLALLQGEPIKEFPVEGIGLTGIGYIDGKLHIQTELKDRGNNDNHGYFYFKDQEGNQIKSLYNFYFRTETESGEHIDYCEEVFDIPKEKLSDYSLYGDFVTSKMKTEGNWRVTFPLESRSGFDDL